MGWLSGGRWRAAVAGLVLVASQFVPLDRSNPPVVSDLAAPDPAGTVLRRSCYDCHSHETRWGWFSHVAPLSWKFAWDVGKARAKVDFSTWRSYRTDKRARLLDKTLEEIDDGAMPPLYYELLRPEARLSDADRELLRSWIQGAGAD